MSDVSKYQVDPKESISKIKDPQVQALCGEAIQIASRLTDEGRSDKDIQTRLKRSLESFISKQLTQES